MAITGDINVIIHRGDRELWDDGEVSLRLIDPFSDTLKVLVEQTLPAGSALVRLAGAPADRGQRYALLASASDYRDAGVFPLKPTPGGVVSVGLLLIRKEPQIDLTSFSYDELSQHSPGFRQALEKAGVDQGKFLSMPALECTAR